MDRVVREYFFKKMNSSSSSSNWFDIRLNDSFSYYVIVLSRCLQGMLANFPASFLKTVTLFAAPDGTILFPGQSCMVVQFDTQESTESALQTQFLIEICRVLDRPSQVSTSVFHQLRKLADPLTASAPAHWSETELYYAYLGGMRRTRATIVIQDQEKDLDENIPPNSVTFTLPEPTTRPICAYYPITCVIKPVGEEKDDDDEEEEPSPPVFLFRAYRVSDDVAIGDTNGYYLSKPVYNTLPDCNTGKPTIVHWKRLHQRVFSGPADKILNEDTVPDTTSHRYVWYQLFHEPEFFTGNYRSKLE
jgi:hypothetical protein